MPAVSSDFARVPLECMSCLNGAAFDAASNTIICPGEVVGFAVYGPYLPVETGFYEVEVDVSVAGPRNPRVYVELWTGATVCKRHVVLARSTLVLSAWIPSKTVLEIRLHTSHTGVTLHGVNVRRVDPFVVSGLGASLAERIGRRHQLRAAIGFAADEPGLASPSAARLFDSIVSDPAFVWIEEPQLAFHENVLRRSCIDSQVVHFIFSRNNTPRFERAGALSPLTDGYPYFTNHFQLEIIRNGYFELPSPFGQGKIRSDASFPVYAPGFGLTAILYEFSTPHHLIVGTAHSWSGAISFMWFVDHDILIHDSDQENQCEWGPILPILRSFVEMCASQRSEALRYRSALKTVACFGGCNSNLGHYFWNDVSGVERVVRSGLHPKFVLGKSKRLSIEEIFRDDDIFVMMREVEDAETLFTYIINNDLLLVRPTGNTIDSDLASKVRRAAVRCVESGGDKPDCLRGIDRDAFVVFYNLRAHNKAWVEQVEGAVELVNRLRSDLSFENIVVFLDGYEDCADLVSQIDVRLSSLCRVVDGTRLPFPETLIWAYRCDFFVAVIGSGLVLLTWLAAKSGICHGDRRHMSQLGWWGSVRPNAGTILSPDMSDIVDVKDHFYTNYKLDPSVVGNLAVEFLRRNNY